MKSFIVTLDHVNYKLYAENNSGLDFAAAAA